MASYKIPMAVYYAKSKGTKERVDETAENFEGGFLKKVSDNIDELDSKDREILEGDNSYISAKSMLNEIKNTHAQNLNNMSSENSQNPLYRVVETDQYYKDEFIKIAENKNQEEVTKELGMLNDDISYLRESREQLSELLGFFDANGYKRLAQIISLDPIKGVEKLLDDKTFLEAINKNETVTEMFLKAMIGMESAGKLPITLVDKIMASDKITNAISKTPVGVQDKFMNLLISFQDKGWKWANRSETALNYFNKVMSGKIPSAFGKGVKKLTDTVIQNKWGAKAVETAKGAAQTRVGKVVTNPWFGLALDGGFSTYNNYKEESSEAHKDIGKAVVGGTIDAISNIGPVRGALLGASIAAPIAPVGAVGGFILGGINAFLNFRDPNRADKVKSFMYEKIDEVRDMGKSVNKEIGAIRRTTSNYMNKMGTEVGKKLKRGRDNLVSSTKKFMDTIPNIHEPMVGWFA